MISKSFIIHQFLIHILVTGSANHEVKEEACRTLCGISYFPPDNDYLSQEYELMEEPYYISELNMYPDPELVEPDDSSQFYSDPEEDFVIRDQIPKQSRWPILPRFHAPSRPRLPHRIPRPTVQPFRSSNRHRSSFSHTIPETGRRPFRSFSNPRADRKPFGQSSYSIPATGKRMTSNPNFEAERGSLSHRTPRQREGPFKSFSSRIPEANMGPFPSLSYSNSGDDRRSLFRQSSYPIQGKIRRPISNSMPGADRRPFRQSTYSIPEKNRRPISKLIPEAKRKPFPQRIPRQREGPFRSFSNQVPGENRRPFPSMSYSNPGTVTRPYRQSSHPGPGRSRRPISYSIPGANRAMFTRSIPGQGKWPANRPGPPNEQSFIPRTVHNKRNSGKFSNSIPSSVNRPFLRSIPGLGDATRHKLSTLIRGDRVQPEMTVQFPGPIARSPPQVIPRQHVMIRPNVLRQQNPNYVPLQKPINRPLGRPKSKTLRTPRYSELSKTYKKRNVIPKDNWNRLANNKPINQKYEIWTLYE